MKIIGTGLSGMVGSRIVELLGGRFEFTDFSLDSGTDITDVEGLAKAFLKEREAKAVLHLAAFTDVDASQKQKDDKGGSCYRVNVLGAQNIARLCAKTNKYLIHISTDFVFDGEKQTAYTEEDEPRPIEWYGQTKLWAEEAVKNSSCDYLILRLAFPFKAKPSPPSMEPKAKLDLVRKIKIKLEEGQRLEMFTDQIITPTFIDDLARTVEKVLAKRPQGIYHAVGGTALSPFELAQKIATTFGLDQKLIRPNSLEDFVHSNGRPRQKRLALSNKKLETGLGVKMQTIDEALATMKSQLTTAS